MADSSNSPLIDASDEFLSSDLIAGLLAGDEQTLRQFYDRYSVALHNIADARVSPRMQPRFDADDVVQSTMRTFFRRAQAGYFQFEDNQRLWSLLCAITLTKLREKARFHSRQARDARRETTADANGEGNASPLENAVASTRGPDDSVEFTDTFQALLASLDETERRIVELKLEDRTIDEVAESLGISERTVRRSLHDLNGKFRRWLTE